MRMMGSLGSDVLVLNKTCVSAAWHETGFVFFGIVETRYVYQGRFVC